jgi:hypothetical protein
MLTGILPCQIPSGYASGSALAATAERKLLFRPLCLTEAH